MPAPIVAAIATFKVVIYGKNHQTVFSKQVVVAFNQHWFSNFTMRLPS